MTTNTKEKTTIILCDLSPDTSKTDIESFLSQYKEQIEDIQFIQFTDKKSSKATVIFKDNKSANECRINMNLRGLKKKSIRIMWEEKDFLQKNKDSKNNLHIKGLPKNKTPHEMYEYFFKFGDIFSMKINENEEGDNNGTAYVTYYNPDDAKKALEETNNKKIWNSEIEVKFHKGIDKYNNYNDNNLKINIMNLPDNYTDQDITKLCEEFGKVHIVNINKKGKSAIVKFNNEQEVKNAKEKLNNKVIDDKKIYVKDVRENHYYNYNYNYNNKHNYYQQNYYYFNNSPMIRFEDPLENNNLYVRNIPHTATDDDLRAVFGKYGKITSIKLEKDKGNSENNEKKDDKEEQKLLPNKGFGYVLFEKIEDARKAYKTLNGTNMPGFEKWPKPLMIDYFVPRDRRQNSTENNPMLFPQGAPGQFPPFSPMFFQMQMPNQYNPQFMYTSQNYRLPYNNNHKQRFKKGYQHRGRGGRYYKNNNYQKKNNKNENATNNTNTNNTTNTNTPENTFDYESFNKLTSNEEKKEFLGERIFAAIQNNLNEEENKMSMETIGKITGMILEIPNENEIIETLEKPSTLDARVKEALALLNSNK